ncbi:hypothetical protein [Piscirickettsia litoralis]|uniref:Uncharacterized protein n=1 Tax=Piscirickettsia litoralis TaxID=1891921 RepID=A0ABX2ZWX5_9GAMM|nr:hypothetical protein [Piscirickettsia litoralis]ODN41119.1 hypothetical protein BGC07_17750 [Piscirickettsia litoralis]
MTVINSLTQAFPHSIVGIASLLVMIASALCATINTPKSKGFISLIYKIIEALALNSSKAKQSGDAVSDLVSKIRQDIKTHNWTGSTDDLFKLLKAVEQFDQGVKPVPDKSASKTDPPAAAA